MDWRWEVAGIALIFVMVAVLLIVAFVAAPSPKKNHRRNSRCIQSSTTGPVGPTGAMGIAINTGPTGPAGMNGVAFNTGPTGDTGVPGPQGMSANMGPSGPTGATGPNGATGSTGTTGPTGVVGSTGPAGIAISGPVGNPGAPITLAPIGAIPNADGAIFFGGILQLEPGSASFGGLVTTGNQSFSGTKTFDTLISPNVIVQKQYYIEMRESSASGQNITDDIETPILYLLPPKAQSNWTFVGPTAFQVPVQGFYEITLSVRSTTNNNAIDYQAFIRDGSNVALAMASTMIFAVGNAFLNITAVAFFPAGGSFVTTFLWQESPPSGADVVNISSQFSQNFTTVLSARFLF